MSKHKQIFSEKIQQELSETAVTLPIYALLPELFKDSRMFDSYEAFNSAGFHLVEHAEHKIMSGSHKLVRGYLFKKYNNDRDGKEQISNYMHRIEGSKLLRNFISEQDFSRVAAPRKWLYELPSCFSEPYLLVAEKLKLVSEDKTLRNYDRIGRRQTRELATILYYFRGLNSTVSNLPFTEDGKIAFVDTERWHHDKDFLVKIGGRLPRSRIRLAEDVYEKLRSQGALAFQSAYKR